MCVDAGGIGHTVGRAFEGRRHAAKAANAGNALATTPFSFQKLLPLLRDEHLSNECGEERLANVLMPKVNWSGATGIPNKGKI